MYEEDFSDRRNKEGIPRRLGMPEMKKKGRRSSERRRQALERKLKSL